MFIDLLNNTARTATVVVLSALGGTGVDLVGGVGVVEFLLKCGAWMFSILLGVLGVITWIQKQKDRNYERQKYEKQKYGRERGKSKGAKQ